MKCSLLTVIFEFHTELASKRMTLLILFFFFCLNFFSSNDAREKSNQWGENFSQPPTVDWSTY